VSLHTVEGQKLAALYELSREVVDTLKYLVWKIKSTVSAMGFEEK
jgi:hypothetical protein